MPSDICPCNEVVAVQKELDGLINVTNVRMENLKENFTELKLEINECLVQMQEGTKWMINNQHSAEALHLKLGQQWEDIRAWERKSKAENAKVDKRFYATWLILAFTCLYISTRDGIGFLEFIAKVF